MFFRKQPEIPAVKYNGLHLDMLKQKHIMIAGATGSGKSVLINGFLRAVTGGPAWENQLILIDPKRVELVAWSRTPNCIGYASEPDTMVAALHRALDITERRYKEMQRRGLKTYDKGHVWVVIDELADLMTTAKREVQPLIQRLGQIGRAANVHMVVATQCPLAVVIPTPIKVNFDCIVGLRTRCVQDSRNILGAGGLEQLPRYGYAIYRTPEIDNALVEVPYYSEAELTNYIESRRRNPKTYWDVCRVVA